MPANDDKQVRDIAQACMLKLNHIPLTDRPICCCIFFMFQSNFFPGDGNTERLRRSGPDSIAPGDTRNPFAWKLWPGPVSGYQNRPAMLTRPARLARSAAIWS